MSTKMELEVCMGRDRQGDDYAECPTCGDHTILKTLPTGRMKVLADCEHFVRYYIDGAAVYAVYRGKHRPSSPCRTAAGIALAALSLSAAACTAPAGGATLSTAATVPSAATSRDTTHFVVFSLTSHQARLQAMQPMGATRPALLVVSIAPDSLSHAVRVGNLVRRCLHPVTSGRVITWCIDHKASGLR